MLKLIKLSLLGAVLSAFPVCIPGMNVNLCVMISLSFCGCALFFAILDM